MSPLAVVEATRVIPTSAEAIFDLLARPDGHAVIDGSGTVTGIQERTPERLALGTKFGMTMKVGLAYKILNEVVEFDEGRRIAWRHFGGHVWRYILEPVDEQTTLVTEQFDPTGSRAGFVLRLMSASRRNRVAIDRTLQRLEEWARGNSAAV